MNQRKEDKSCFSTSGDLETAICVTSRNQPMSSAAAYSPSHQNRWCYQRECTPILCYGLAERLDREFLQETRVSIPYGGRQGADIRARQRLNNLDEGETKPISRIRRCGTWAYNGNRSARCLRRNWINSQESGSRLVGSQTRWHRYRKLSQHTCQVSVCQLYALGQTRRSRAVAEHGRLLAALCSKRNGHDHISGVLFRNQQFRVAEERGIDGSWTIDVKAG